MEYVSQKVAIGSLWTVIVKKYVYKFPFILILLKNGFMYQQMFAKAHY